MIINQILAFLVLKKLYALYTDSQITNNKFHSTHPNICAIKYFNRGFNSIAQSV
jgi:hypothetical protein